MKQHSEESTIRALELIRELFGDYVAELDHNFQEGGRLLYIKLALNEKLDRDKTQVRLEDFKLRAIDFLPSYFLNDDGEIEDIGWMVDVYYNGWGIDVMCPDRTKI